MRWESERQSDNVDDRRGLTVGRGAVGGGAILLAIVAALLGAPEGTVRQILGGGSPVATDSPGAQRSGPPDPQTKFVKVVLASTEDTWTELFTARGRSYRKPTLDLFSGVADSACGTASAAVGPF